MSKYYEQIRKYYLFGYGYPVKYYTEKNLDNFVAAGLLTQEECDALKAEKAAMEE